MPKRITPQKALLSPVLIMFSEFIDVYNVKGPFFALFTFSRFRILNMQDNGINSVFKVYLIL